MTQKKAMLAILLGFVLITTVGLMSVEDEVSAVDIGADTDIDSIQSLIKDNDNVTLTLIGDITITKKLTISDGHTVSLYCKSNSGEGCFKIIRGEGHTESLFVVESGANLIIQNVIMDGGYAENTSSMKSLAAMVKVDGGKVSIKGATLCNNYNENSNDFGGAIFICNSGSVIMDGGEITGNTSNNGGAVRIAGGSFTLNWGTVSDNVALRNGGAFSLAGYMVEGKPVPNSLVIKKGEIFENEARLSPLYDDSGKGGAIYLFGDDSARLDHSEWSVEISGGTFSSNKAHTYGGVIAQYAGCVSMSEATFKNNNAVNGGVIYNSSGDLKISGGEYDGNKVTKSGGAFYIGSKTFESMDIATGGHRIFKNNNALNGGAIYCDTSGKITITGMDFSNNSTISEGAMGGGGALFVKSGQIVLKNVVMDQNTAGNGGAIYVASGIVMMSGDDWKMRISGNSVNENGGGGGVLVCGNGKFTMDSGCITGNTAKNGGGVRVIENGSFTMNGGSISGNTAKIGNGAGVIIGSSENGSTFIMNGGEISGNKIVEAVTTGGYGSGIHVFNSLSGDKVDVQLIGGKISGNTSSYTEEGGDCQICVQSITSGVIMGAVDYPVGNVFLSKSAKSGTIGAFKLDSTHSGVVNVHSASIKTTVKNEGVTDVALGSAHIQFENNKITVNAAVYEKYEKECKVEVKDSGKGFIVIYTANTYVVTLNSNGGTTNGMVNVKYGSGSVNDYNAASKTGYELTGYFISAESDSMVIGKDGNLIDSVEGFTDSYGNWMNAGGTILYAKWTANTYEVEFISSSGTNNIGERITQTYDSVYKFPQSLGAPEGYIFQGWFTEQIGGTKVDAETVFRSTSDLNLYAHYSPRDDISYTVHYYIQGTETKLADDKIVGGKIFGNTVTESAISISGYDASAASKTLALNKVEGNTITFYYVAQYVPPTPGPTPDPTPEPVYVKVDVTVPGVGGNVSGAGSYISGANVTLTAAADPYYIFDGWYLNGVLYSNEQILELQVSEDISLTAHFRVDTSIEERVDVDFPNYLMWMVIGLIAISALAGVVVLVRRYGSRSD